jgi:mono/diheme cytochrome c family protein
VEIRGSKSWQAPDGTVLAQTLAHDGRKIETRVLVKQQNDWAGYTYAWNNAQTDAILAPKEGADIELGSGQPWRVPSRAECLMCHSRQANFALTLHDAQLNHGDQLQRWERAGMLSSNAVAFGRERAQIEQRPGVSGSGPDQRPAPASPLLPLNPEHLARFVSTNDPNAGLEHRARSYLGANCAHCHTLYGGGNSAMDFDWLVPLKETAALNREPQHGAFELADARVIAPGVAARSVLTPRVSRRGPGQMPPIGSRVADPDGTRLLVEWIESLPQ